MILIILSVFIFIQTLLLGIIFIKQKSNAAPDEKLASIILQLELLNNNITQAFSNQRVEMSQILRQQRDEMNANQTSFKNSFAENINKINDELRQTTKLNIDNLKDIRNLIHNHLSKLTEDNNKQLTEMRHTVDEKLQKTINARLEQSFSNVGNQLKIVQESLGEMKTLANDVGGLKKVLSNVKMRGSFGEVQLAALLEQILAPSQYAANVKTNKNSDQIVEFAIKLPGNLQSNESIWLPIDAKFPKDVYQAYQEALEGTDKEVVAKAYKNLEATIKQMAKDIQQKYLNPPYTTDFAIMFLPFEGIYAEILRHASLLEIIQNKYKVIITGPTTLAAILNSLQIGFRTLAIQKKSSEVWQILAEVKTEFGNFGDLMHKAQKNIQIGLNQLDDVMGVRTRQIQRSLQNVEDLSKLDHKVEPDV